jgi:hypothetical protein
MANLPDVFKRSSHSVLHAGDARLRYSALVLLLVADHRPTKVLANDHMLALIAARADRTPVHT